MATAVRPTQTVQVEATALAEPLCAVSEIVPHSLPPSAPEAAGEGIAPGGAVFQPDGKVLARFGERLVYFVGDKAHKVAVPAEHRRLVGATRWLSRGPGGGFALVGEEMSDHAPMVAYWQRGQRNHDVYISHMPSMMDFPLVAALRKGLLEPAIAAASLVVSGSVVVVGEVVYWLEAKGRCLAR